MHGEAGYQADTLAPGMHMGLWPWQYAVELARAFLAGGGQRGPQMSMIPPGTYRMNPFLFSVTLADAVDIPDNKVGIVTTREGSSLAAGEIAGPVIPGHSMFQNRNR